jgi:hypothetical protein
MAIATNKWILGILTLVILTSSIYIMMPESVRLDVGKTSTLFKVWEGKWVTSATEYIDIYSGTSKLKVINVTLSKEITGTKAKIIRDRWLAGGINVKDIYEFDGTVKDIELFPISHNIEITGAKGKILQFKVSGLYGNVLSRDAISPESFGKQMKVYWQDGAYYQKIVYSKTTQKDTLTVKYKITSNAQTFNVRVFDPPLSETYSSSSTGFWNATEGSSTGARLTASILSMDFNTAGEASSTTSIYNTSFGTYIKDSSIYNNFGTITEPSPFMPGIVNNSLSFDGVNDYVSVTPSSNLNMSGKQAVTISYWINPNTISGTQVFTSKGSYTLETYTSNGDLNFRMVNNSGAQLTTTISAVVLQQGVWQFLTFIFETNATGSTAYIYKNATLLKNSSFVSNNIGDLVGNFEIGRYSSGLYYNGMMDEVMLFNRSLSASEITNLYNNQSAGLRNSGLENDTSLIMYHYLDGPNVTKSLDKPNAVSRWWVPGVNGTNGLTFDGTNDLVRQYTAITPNNWVAPQFTISGWAKLRGGNWYQVIAGIPARFNLNYGAADAKCVGGKIGFTIYNTSDVYNCISADYSGYNNSVWMHYAGVYNGTHMMLYINGVKQANITAPGIAKTISASSEFDIGGITTYPLYSINGTTDEIMLFNRSLSDAEILSLYQNQSLGIDDSLVNDVNLISYFRLNETNGTTAYNSVTGKSNGTLTNYDSSTTYPGFNDGTLTNFGTFETSPTWNATGGYDGSGAYSFEGSGSVTKDADIITIPLVSTKTEDFSVSIWAKPYSNSTALSSFVLCNGNCGTNGWILRWRSGEFIFDSTGHTVGTGYNASLNQWHHVVGIRTNGTFYTCLNGICKNTSTTTIVTPTVSTTIGGYRTAIYGFNGTIDQVQIFPRALSASEVLDLYNGTMSGKVNKYPEYNGNFQSGVFYNSTSSYWNITLSTADTTSRSGLVNNDNSINISNPNLVSYWSLDNNYLDATGRNNGTCSGTSCPNNASGLSSSAMRFDGVDDYVTIGDVINMGTNDMTLSAWFKSPDVSLTRGIIVKRRATAGADGYELYLSTTGTVTGILGGLSASTYTASTPSSYDDNNWHLATVVYNRSENMSIYVDGVKQTSLNISGENGFSIETTYSLGLGVRDALDEAFYNGSLDEVLIYNTSLTQAEIQQLYKSGLSQKARTNVTIQTRTANTYNITDPSLVSFWSFNNDNATTAFDELGRNNGTREGSIVDANDGNGTVGKGYYFDGTNDQIDINIAIGNYTISAWIKNSTSSSWSYIVYTNFSTINYTNGVVQNPVQKPINKTIIGKQAATFFIGSIDEVRIYNRSLSAEEVLDLYNLGATHISDWTAWQDEDLMQDGVSKLSTGQGKFAQFKSNLNTNTTDISPYVVNYNIVSVLGKTPFVLDGVRSENAFAVTEFVNRSGKSFTLSGNNYTLLGANAYYLADYAMNLTYDDDGNQINNSREAVLEILDKAQSLNINVIRTWVNMMGGNCSQWSNTSTKQGYVESACWNVTPYGGHYNLFINNVPGNYSENMFRSLDWVIYEASKRDIRIMPVFVNNWGEYGGMRWYVMQSPTTDKTYANISSNADDAWWTFHDQFYSDANVKQYYKDYINFTLNRTNTYSGLQYKNDPAIFAWLLANEPRAKSRGANATLVRLWTTEMVSFVKSIDQNHLVGMGIEGIALNESWGDGVNMIDIHNTTGVDFATFAMHPNQWDWFVQRSENATDGGWLTGGVADNRTINFWTWGAGYTLNNRYTGGLLPANWIPRYPRHGYKNWVAMNTNISNSLNLPVLAQEVAYPTAQPKNLRDKFFQQGINSFFNEGGDGFLFWNFNHDNYYYSTEDSSYAGKMDDGYSYYFSTDAFLANKSSSVIEAFDFALSNNTGGTSWVTVLNNNYIVFHYNVTLNDGVNNCSLWINTTNTSSQSTGWYLDQTNISEIVNGENLFNKQFESTDVYSYWYIMCCDNTSCQNTSTEYVSTPPLISLTSPADNSIINTTTIQLNYTVESGLIVNHCELFINGDVNASNTDISSSSVFQNNFTITVAGTPASYMWQVRCTDMSENTRYSTRKTFVYNAADINISLLTPAAGTTSVNSSNNYSMAVNSSAPISLIHLYLSPSEQYYYYPPANTNKTQYGLSVYLGDGYYEWYYNVTDIFGVTKKSEVRNLTIHTIPLVQFVSPSTTTGTYNQNYIDANVTATDDNTIDNITITIYNSGGVLAGSYIRFLNQAYYRFNGLSNGVYYLNATACNNVSECENSETRTITLSTGGPIITIESPLAQIYTVNRTWLNISLAEAPAACWFNLDATGNKTLLNNTPTYFYNYTGELADGQHTVVFYCNDSLSVTNSVTRIFGVDTIPPVITLHHPLTTTYLNSNSILFNYTPDSGGDSLDVCLLYGNWSGWGIKDTDTSPVDTTINNFTEIISDGTYKWNVWCNDSLGIGSYSAQGNQTFVVDTTSPAIRVLSPIMNTIYYVSDIWFNATANKAISSWLIDYNGVNQSFINATRSLTPGIYNVTFWANDSAGNWGMNDSVVNFQINLEPTVQFTSPTTSTGTHNQTWIYYNVSASYGDGLSSLVFDLWNSTDKIFTATNITSGTSMTLRGNRTGLAYGTYYINATANAANGGKAYTETRTIILSDVYSETTIPLTDRFTVTFNKDLVQDNLIYTLEFDTSSKTAKSYSIVGTSTATPALRSAPYVVDVIDRESGGYLTESCRNYFSIQEMPHHNEMKYYYSWLLNEPVAAGTVMTLTKVDIGDELHIIGIDDTFNANSLRLYANDFSGNMIESDIPFYVTDVS